MEEIVLADTWRDRVEDALARVRENRTLTAVVAGSVLLSLALWAREPSPRVAPPARASLVPVTDASPSTGGTTVVVHVAGSVRDPGLYEFPLGARIGDAIATAGGASRTADLDALNLAELLVDGARIAVPARSARTVAVPSTAPGPATSVEPALVPLNSADAAALETIPGIGPVTAQAILDHRAQVGGFASIDELLDVDGIGPATLESIRPYLTL